MSIRAKFSAGFVSALAVACLLFWPATVAGADATGPRADGIGFTFPQVTPDYAGGGANASRFSLRLYGGFSRIGASDLNAGFDGYYELFELYEASGYGTVTGGYTPLKNGYNAGADIIYEITPRIGIGIGAGYLRTSANSMATWSYEGFAEFDLPATATLSAIPVRLGLFLTFPLGGKLNLTADAGAAYYAALKVDATQRVEFDEDWFELSIAAQRSSFANLGFQGSLGLEYMFSPKMGFFVEALGRYARFKNFEKATGRSQSSGGTPFTTEGKIYLATMSYPSLGAWSMFTVEEDPPTSSPPSEVYTEPKIDLSGFSLQAGIRIRF